MRHRPGVSPIPNFAQIFGAGVGSVALTPVAPGAAAAAAGPRAPAPDPAAGPIDKEIRRINSAHQPEVREVASDNEIGRDIVDEDARRLAAQQRSVRKQERTRR
ncbi:hypothetical protein J8I26_15070 [Herbaspirillum sp. LeCh32-8]|uniref:hypothetical protein n=1 Tax=Herbaspirillum sp. LeCh32-8 TaxID=2821356 RepID=UPI001AE6D9B2|nr:hypothetical protein [Herbaspirillum sp. LeCh32-8]MBP0599437.1 hypothetical protein [Herbaspirillum sp. LeCh32-8]